MPKPVSKPSEKNLLKQIEVTAKELAQYSADAEYWYQKTLDEIIEKQKEPQKEIEEKYNISITNIQEEYNRSIQQIRAELARLNDSNSLPELSWDTQK